MGRIPKITKQALVKQARPIITNLVSHAIRLAGMQQKTIITDALASMNESIIPEHERLKRLSRVNKAIRPEELEHFSVRHASLAEALSSAQLVLDAVRVAIVTRA